MQNDIFNGFNELGQAAVEAGHKRYRGIGDGWLRLMNFDFSTQPAHISIKTYSSYYNSYSSDLDQYAFFYRELEQPQMSDAEFHEADEFILSLE